MMKSLLALSSIVCFTTSAHATATAAASLSNVRIQVVDLDLLDGIEAGITFSSGYGTLDVLAGGAGSQSLSGTGALGSAIGPLTATSSYASASGAVIAGDLLLGASPSVTASATGSAPSFADSRAYPNSVFYFTLTANTSLVFTGDAAITSSATDDGEFALGIAGMGLRVDGAETGPEGFALSYEYPLGGVPYGEVIVLDSNGFGGSGFSFDGRSGSGSLLVTYDNTSANSVNGVGWFFSLAQITVPVAPVPEPSTYALMLAGLAAVAFAAKRRRVTVAHLTA